MLTLEQMEKAINDKITSSFDGTKFAGLKVTADDVAKPVKRPAIKAMREGSINSLFNSRCREKTLTYRVYFFAENEKKPAADNMRMQDIVETTLLDGLYIDGAYIPIETVESDIVDTVLICSFDVYAVELLPDDEATTAAEIMEEIKLKEGI